MEDLNFKQSVPVKATCTSTASDVMEERKAPIQGKGGEQRPKQHKIEKLGSWEVQQRRDGTNYYAHS